MSCADCTQARAKTWGGYAPGCIECIARSIARSREAFDALGAKGSGDRLALREQIARRLPETPVADARRMVYEWWRHDRAQAPAGAGCS